MVQIRSMGPQIGVEVTGVDVKTLDDADFAPIYQAWLDHNVMVVRDQELTIEEFLHYSRRFGLVVPHPSKSTRHPEIPEITLLGVNKFGADGKLNEAIYRRGAEGWHTDGAYDAEPFKATQLYALAIPSTGGDTMFANGYAAYEALPARLKERLEGRVGGFTYGGRRKSRALLNPEDRDWTPVFHPIVRTHPETGRKALYVNTAHTVRFEGMTEEESAPLLHYLFRHQVKAEFTCRFQWREGSLAFWDNRCTQHNPINDYHGYRRVMHRVTLAGDRPQ
jgi:taurine dioxygenase